MWTKGTWGNGYGRLVIEGQQYSAHRVAWEISNNAKAPAGMLVCHKCDNPPCCNPNHLFLGSPHQNMRDKREKGRGVGNLTPDQVREIRARQGNITHMAKHYGASRRTVQRIKAGTGYKHVPDVPGGIAPPASPHPPIPAKERPVQINSVLAAQLEHQEIMLKLVLNQLGDNKKLLDRIWEVIDPRRFDADRSH